MKAAVFSWRRLVTQAIACCYFGLIYTPVGMISLAKPIAPQEGLIDRYRRFGTFRDGDRDK
jgi:hypothetical protein